MQKKKLVSAVFVVKLSLALLSLALALIAPLLQRVSGEEGQRSGRGRQVELWIEAWLLMSKCCATWPKGEKCFKESCCVPITAIRAGGRAQPLGLHGWAPAQEQTVHVNTQCTSAYSWKVSIIDGWQEKEYPQSLYQTEASLFSYSTKRKHNRNTKTCRDETDLTKSFQSKWSFCQALTLPVCGGNVLLNITVKYSVVPTTRSYYINGGWLQKDGGSAELRDWQPGSQTAVKDDATLPTTHSLKSARRQTKIEEQEEGRMKRNDIKK